MSSLLALDFSLSSPAEAKSEDTFLSTLLIRARWEAGIVVSESILFSPPLQPTALTQLAIIEPPLRLPLGYGLLTLRARELLRDGLVV
jgi:hypothetical protein